MLPSQQTPQANHFAVDTSPSHTGNGVMLCPFHADLYSLLYPHFLISPSSVVTSESEESCYECGGIVRRGGYMATVRERERQPSVPPAGRPSYLRPMLAEELQAKLQSALATLGIIHSPVNDPELKAVTEDLYQIIDLLNGFHLLTDPLPPARPENNLINDGD